MMWVFFISLWGSCIAYGSDIHTQINVLSTQIQTLNERLTKLEHIYKKHFSTDYKAMTIYPNFVVGCRSGLSFLKKGRVDDALQALRYILETFPHHAKVFIAQYWLGQCYAQIGDWKEAYNIWQKTLLQHPKAYNRQALLLALAQSAVKMKDMQQARYWINQMDGTKYASDMDGLKRFVDKAKKD